MTRCAELLSASPFQVHGRNIGSRRVDSADLNILEYTRPTQFAINCQESCPESKFAEYAPY